MILSEILELPAHDAEGGDVGWITDVRFALERSDTAPPTVSVVGLIIGRRRNRAFLGYERTGETAPALIAGFLRWRARDSFLVLWRDVEIIDEHVVRLRPGYRRYSPSLPRG